MERRRNRRFPIQIPVKRWASRRESLFRWAAADFLQCLPHPACVGVAAVRFCYENLFTFINRSRRLHPAAKLFSGSALCCLHSLAETPFIRAFQPKFALNPTPQDDRANQHNGCEENPSNQRQEKMIKPITMAIAASPTSRLKSGLPPGCGKMNIGIRPISFGSSLGSVGSSMLNLLLEKYIDPQNKSAWRCFYYMGTRSVLPCVIMQAIVSTLLNENGHEKTRASLRSVKIIDFSKSVPAA